ncbi:hypothetical protein FRC03_009807 [Tulasnella sp. 419]|nr:hypothetical protein FRC03_009807 [Tulasnella sp. 419]
MSFSTSSSSYNNKGDQDVMTILESSAEIIAKYILSNLSSHGPRLATTPNRRPLFVGLQGPQGVGKTTLTRKLLSTLSSSPNSLNVAILSLDDIYLPHEGLVRVAQSNPQNGLLQGRGQPGTHDVELGESLFKQFVKNNEDVEIPVFDKSQFNGEGDRLSQGIKVKTPVDVVLFEGWSMGFYPLEQEQLRKRYLDVTSSKLDIVPAEPDVAEIVKRHRVDDLLVVNEFLKGYVEKLYPYFDIFVKIGPPKERPFGAIYGWRLEQEHYMKSTNGGVGMSDEAVRHFVDRYIPGYVFFADGVEKGYNTGEDEAVYQVDKYPPWKGRLLRITVNENREVTSWDTPAS